MHCVIFSDIPNNRLPRYDEVKTGQRRTADPPRDRTEYDGSITVLADNYEGKTLNSPNGVVVKSDNTVWFTGPSYRGKSELPRNVYRFDPKSNKLTVAVGDFNQPNAICFSPNEKKLYISDTSGSPSNIRVFDAGDDGPLTNGSVFHDFADTHGLLDTTAASPTT